MESGRKRKAEELPLTVGEMESLAEVPFVNFKDVLKLPLPKFILDLSGKGSSDRPGTVPDEVYRFSVAKEVRDRIRALPDIPMHLQDPIPACSVFQSENSCNAEQQRVLFEPINYILAQWPEGTVKQYRVRLNALQPDRRHSERDSLCGEFSNTTNATQPDNEVLRTFDQIGNVALRARSALACEGKRWSVFIANLPDNIIHSGHFDLGKAYMEDSEDLSPDARSAFYQLVRYLFLGDMDEGILYTLMVLWIVRIVNRIPLKVAISEPITRDSVNPSMREVAFVTILKAVERLENKSERRRRELEAVGVTARDGGEGGMRSTEEYKGAAGVSSSVEQQPSTSTLPNTGDALIANFREVSAPILGNSMVRVGRIDNGEVVAAKFVPGDDEDWVREFDNEARSLDEMKVLQGTALPEKVYAGKVHNGKDRLLVTKLVEGQRLDEVAVTSQVANNARKVLGDIHNLGFSHGDVAPRNIIVKKSGQVVFVDLGRARKGSEALFEQERKQLEKLF
ncbi:hypothetical protein KFL_015150010 [Klebsormidium nitens]|uniref:ABC1 atypical kinase-like domain-containing protein n=1 Tax=Klebsormidium nitens TaxID=105231 RepID=A0A1Y1IRV1_KLENI|nr:hypothetical protein KFL_015150010 [Klebsormidium nitens]|eukprot:GAQ93423.1 hypothetical protein KFL_015150010 [Klebsormidium nitens]